jgi:hypothetical protein
MIPTGYFAALQMALGSPSMPSPTLMLDGLMAQLHSPT